MGAITTTSAVLDTALREAGLDEQFDTRGRAYEDCPSCGARGGLKLSLGQGRVSCQACGLEGPLLAYLRERAEAGAWEELTCQEAEIIALEPRLPQLAPVKQAPLKVVDIEVEPSNRSPKGSQSQLVSAGTKTSPKWGEHLIITLLALIFLLAGLAAAALSGFANYQAFSSSVGDPLQARVWGWSGVIAAVCSFGGFTFFWWHVSARRLGEAVRALLFALAGAGTSLAGTSLYMLNNETGLEAASQQAQAVQALQEAELADWARQLEGIPPETRSVEGLEAYLAGVEAAGRTHQKPYRDAQNELGLAKRRAELEAKIASGRAALRDYQTSAASTPASQSLPAWFFALMLEVFSSQGTSIAFVSLLLLYGRKSEAEDQFRVSSDLGLAGTSAG